MGASEWREAGEVFANKFPDISKTMEHNIEAEVELIDFLMSDDGQVAQALLLAGNHSIDLGSASLTSHISNGCRIEMLYSFDGYGLRWRSEGERKSFVAIPLDVVHGFYRFDRNRGSIVGYIKKQLDGIATQMLREATPI